MSGENKGLRQPRARDAILGRIPHHAVALNLGDDSDPLKDKPSNVKL
jgi:hypothetical protein